MISTNFNSKKWIAKAINKLKAYLTRAPLMVSTIIENQSSGVTISIDQTKQSFFFNFDFTVDPKTWVHEIKNKLVPYYPRLVEDIKEVHALTPAEQALKAEESGIDNIPVVEYRTIKQNCWRIDKVILHKDIIILYLEGYVDKSGNKIAFKPTDTPILRRFKYTGNAILFLRKERNGVFKSNKEFSEDFFNNSIPLDDVTVKDN